MCLFLNVFFKLLLTIFVQLSRMEGTSTKMGEAAVESERIESGQGYRLHMYGGSFHRVPVNWRFPRCGVHDLWRQWWVGDTERNIPPLKLLKIDDIKHIDKAVLSETEKERKVGPNKNKRRVVKKVLTDMRFICKYLSKLVKEKGKMEEVITLSSVDRMFSAVAGLVLDGNRDSQKQWLSVVRQLRRKKCKWEIEIDNDDGKETIE